MRNIKIVSGLAQTRVGVERPAERDRSRSPKRGDDDVIVAIETFGTLTEPSRGH